MGTGSRNLIGSTDFPSERSGTHLKKNPIVFLAISTPNQYSRTRSSCIKLCINFVVFNTTNCTVFVFQIGTLFEKFKNEKFSNFQTIVTGRRNSTAGQHVVVILYCILNTVL